jgi:hypothetical protein
MKVGITMKVWGKNKWQAGLEVKVVAKWEEKNRH